MNKQLPKLYLVIPCYNEEEILPVTCKELEKKMQELIDSTLIAEDSRVVLVNDGSRDRTWDIITEKHNDNPLYVGINLSRNRGHQNALLAGLMYAKDHCDITVSMDADLQDDIGVINDMIARYNEGADIVYGVRSSRKKDSFFKKFTAEGFYKLMAVMGVEIVFNHADCRLMTQRALEALDSYKERNLFLRGIVPQLGYNTAIAYYERNERIAGESKYPLKKMLAFALDGITSFSIKPLRLITALGTVMTLAGLVMLILFLCMKEVALSIISSVILVGGIQVTCLGIIGEYIGKIYNETKARPHYIVENILD